MNPVDFDTYEAERAGTMAPPPHRVALVLAQGAGGRLQYVSAEPGAPLPAEWFPYEARDLLDGCSGVS